MARPPSLRAAVVGLVLCGAGTVSLPGQQPAAWSEFTAPDGSRFVLLPDPSMSLVHWAVATLAEDPPGLAGLSSTVLEASLCGTWTSGSANPREEQLALEEQDSAFHAWLGDKADSAAVQNLMRCNEAVARLGDTSTFRRVLAAAPVHRPQVVDHPPVCVLVLSTVPDALAEVGRRLVERREDVAMRDLQPLWMQTLLARAAAQAGNETALRAEVLALAIPDHPFGRLLERPGLVAPRRAEALATWRTTQRPDRTIHVLLGGFDPTAAAAALKQVFAATSLAAGAAPAGVRPRPIQSLRRSVVPGCRTPTLALAFVLPPIADPTTIEAAARWLGDGDDSRIGQELLRLGHKDAAVHCTAPWPATVGAHSLLLLEVANPAGIDRLADVVHQACRRAAATPPSPASLEPVLAAMQSQWTRLTNDPRLLVQAVAEGALLWPGLPPRTSLPDRLEPKAIQELLARVFADPPVVVEGRP